MRSYTLQDWIEISGQSSVSAITQSESGWMDMSSFQDVVAWLQVDDMNTGGALQLALEYQTAPTKDDLMFVPAGVVNPLAIASLVTTPMLKFPFFEVSPVCRWLRWQLLVIGTPTSTWDVCFRILIAADGPACAQTAPTVTTAPSTGAQGIAGTQGAGPAAVAPSSSPTGAAGPAPGCGCGS
jgi:hypothetical protein